MTTNRGEDDGNYRDSVCGSRHQSGATCVLACGHDTIDGDSGMPPEPHADAAGLQFYGHTPTRAEAVALETAYCGGVVFYDFSRTTLDIRASGQALPAGSIPIVVFDGPDRVRLGYLTAAEEALASELEFELRGELGEWQVYG